MTAERSSTSNAAGDGAAPPPPAPRGVVGVIDGRAADALAAGAPLPRGLGGVELRADLVASPTAALELCSRLAPRLPLLFTIRRRAEGGRFDGTEAERVGLARSARARGAALVDVEGESAAAEHLSRIDGLPLVLSWHDFHAMPAADDLRRRAERIESLRPAVVKIVPTAARAADAATILEWVAAAPPGGPTRVGFAMGEAGVASRILSGTRGAPYTYGALGDAVAPGQLSASALLEVYRYPALEAATRVLAIAGPRAARDPRGPRMARELARRSPDRVLVPVVVRDLPELESIRERLRIEGAILAPPLAAEAGRPLLADDPETEAFLRGVVGC